MKKDETGVNDGIRKMTEPRRLMTIVRRNMTSGRRVTERIFQRVLDAGVNLLAPRRCALCANLVDRLADGVACGTCWEAYQKVRGAHRLVCVRCGRWRRTDTAARAWPTCAQCREAGFTVARACGPYVGALRATLLALKREPYVPGTLRTLIGETWEGCSELHDIERIVPVPLAPERLKRRGFNQAAEIARILSRLADRPLDEDSVRRTVETAPHRVGMDDVERKNSVGKAFKTVRPRLIEGRRILLVDDVMTSGSTLNAVTAALLAGGAVEVKVLTAGRTRKDSDG